MARILDYQFDNFTTDVDGTRKVVNAGTGGSAYDAVMYTGQGMYTDGVDDRIDTIDPSFLVNGGAIIKHQLSLDTGRDGIWDGTSRLYLSADLIGWGGIYNSYVGQIPENARIVMSSADNATVGFYVNGGLLESRTGTGIASSGFTQLYSIGVRSDAGTTFQGTHLLLAFLDQYMTDADVSYDAANPEAIVEMVATGVQNPNFSFAPSNIRHLFVFDEGTGSVVYDIVTGTAYSMQNFPTDDTQWTNADQMQYGHQKARFKKDANGNPTSPADTGTIRFD